MKIIKFRGGLIGSPYAYVKCWPWEKFAIHPQDEEKENRAGEGHMAARS